MGPDDKQGQKSDQSAAKQPQQAQERDKSPSRLTTLRKGKSIKPMRIKAKAASVPKP
ncbi:hypothetical protein QWZ10_26255 [Paracoccus cavernae]|uniref:Uncharacterized protein n=1 Tax=Paracoccus cavernae TaxID=1571207 RepID=A0ABT8DCB8_9RHOB|nr:hypothetical protein [Paracoccus cavernae]